MDVKKVEMRFLRDDGLEFILGNEDWGILSLEGADSLETEIYTESDAMGEGEFITGEQVKSREIIFVADTKRLSDLSVKRQSAMAFFNRKRSFKVYLSYRGVTRWIEGRLAGFKCPTNNVFEAVEITGTLLCPEPYWKSVDEFGKDIANIIPAFGFPYIAFVGQKYPVGYSEFSKEVHIYNDGDAETQIRAVIKAKDTVTNPALTKDEYGIYINATMQAGDVVEIDFSKRSVTMNGNNIITKLQKKSSLVNMTLEMGDNVITYMADAGDANMSVYVYYNKRYQGV